MRIAVPIAVAVLAACRHDSAGHGMQFPPVPVSVTTVVPRDIPVTLEYLGRTEASREVEVRARVTGFLESRHFTEGAMVATGDLLFQIDQKPLKAQLVWAEAEVQAADARWQQTTREAERLEPLVADEAISKKERDDAVSQRLIAGALLAGAKARLHQIQLDLEYTRVTAPIAGKIGRALRPEGSLVDTGDQGLLTTLLQLDPIYVDFHRTENQQFALDADIKSGRIVLSEGGKFDVELHYRDGTVLATGGAVDFTDGQLNTATGTIPMRATLPNPGQKLRAGQAVRVVLRGARLVQAIAVPQRVVGEGPQGKQVFVAVPGEDGGMVAQARMVEVGEWVELEGTGPASRAWVIRSGLTAGDAVILDNLMKLSPGAKIAVDAPAKATGAPDVPAPSDGDGKGDKDK